MSAYDKIWKNVYQTTTSVALNTAWLHWAALGGNAYRSSNAHLVQVVDPEALILLSLAYRNEEPRLDEMVSWWADSGSPFTSVHRLKSLLSDFGENGSAHLTTFASLAAESGHRGWGRLASPDSAYSFPRKAASSQEPNFRGPATLMIRMRAAFGTGSKSDVLSYLVGSRDSASTVAGISRAVGYTKTSVRDALSDIVRSGIAHESSDWPAEYSTNRHAWRELLRIKHGESELIPRWCHWIQIFGFLVGLKNLIERSDVRGMNEHLLTSKSRDLSERYRNAFAYHGLIVPDHSSYKGREYVEGLYIFCRSLEEWVEQDSFSRDDR